ncbi:MAG: hypothetical protein WCE94_03265 [Candidatus Methanoperedens sp.]
MGCEDVVNKIVEVSKGMTIEYEVVKFNGISLLITKSKLKPLIALTWERTHDSELEKFAKGIGLELRKFR